MKRKVIMIFLILIIISLSFFGVGLYFNSITRPQYIYSKIIDKFNYRFSSIIDYYKVFLEKDDFNISTDIVYKLNGENTDTNVINNLNNYKTSIVFKHDTNSDKLLFNALKANSSNSLYNYKYLIDNSTEYVFFSDFNNQFINMGGSNYFENYNNNSLDWNISYLYKGIIKSLKNNLITSSFKSTYSDITIDNKIINTRKLSIRVDNKYLNNLFNNIITDLKKDKTSYKILKNMYSDIDKYKSNYKFLSKDEFYNFNVYITKTISNPLKYEIEYFNGNNKTSYNYEVLKNGGNLKFYSNDKLKYTGILNIKSNDYNIELFDEKSSGIGDFRLVKNNNSLKLLFNISDDKNIQFNYNSKFSNNTYNDDISIKNIFGLYGDISIVSKISSYDKITEDISESLLYSTLSEEDKNKYSDVFSYINNKLTE